MTEGPETGKCEVQGGWVWRGTPVRDPGQKFWKFYTQIYALLCFLASFVYFWVGATLAPVFLLAGGWAIDPLTARINSENKSESEAAGNDKENKQDLNGDSVRDADCSMFLLMEKVWSCRWYGKCQGWRSRPGRCQWNCYSPYRYQLLLVNIATVLQTQQAQRVNAELTSAGTMYLPHRQHLAECNLTFTDNIYIYTGWLKKVHSWLLLQ